MIEPLFRSLYYEALAYWFARDDLKTIDLINAFHKVGVSWEQICNALIIWRKEKKEKEK